MQIKAFNSLRPGPEHVEELSCPPYDVVEREEVRQRISNSPFSFLRITRSDGELPDDIDAHSEEVYDLARNNLRKFVSEGVLFREEGPSLYIYRQSGGGEHVQTGLVGCVSVDDYESRDIRVHEKTRPAKVRDRMDHMLNTGLHAEPVFLAYRAEARIAELICRETRSEPLYDFTSEDGVGHVVWRVSDPRFFSEAFSSLSRVYIADGHHRAESARQCCREIGNIQPGSAAGEAAGYFLAVLFPHDELKILPYNRIIRKLPASEESILGKLSCAFDVRKTDSGTPPSKGLFCLYIGGSWHLLTPGPAAEHSSPVESLDVSVLSRLILRPIFGIEDERTDSNLDFVGGIHGPERLEELVRKGEASCAFSMFPVTIEELFAVADTNLLMPPKSTWFEPKLRSGLFIHQFMPVPGVSAA